MDLVLVLDVSPPMSYNMCNDDLDNDGDGLRDECSVLKLTDDFGLDANGGNGTPESDVATCRAAVAPENKCDPFEEVREAAYLLVDRT